MTRGRRKDPGRWLFGGIVATLVAAVALVTWSSFELRARQLRLAEATLERAQGTLRTRIGPLFQGIGEDLLEEAAAVEEMEAPDARRLMERWRPLMASQWAITAMALADQSGNEIALVRDGDGMLLLTTAEGSKHAPPQAVRVAARPGGDVPQGTLPLSEPYDPRAQTWFGKALEDARNEPVWNLRFAGDTVPRLQVSLLVRRTVSDDRYRILMLDIDPARMPLMDEWSLQPGLQGAMLLDGDGRRLDATGPRKAPAIADAERAAALHWAGTKTRGPFPATADGRGFRAFVEPCLLNGQTLYTGVLVDMEALATWTDAERRGLVIAAVLVVLLTVLLGLVWLRRRREERRALREAERSRSQERRLEQALGEREVLNREVHHRVKNNLQVVSSLLNLQAARLDEGPVRDEFLRGKRRIDTIALVHHKLYALKDLRNVDLRTFFDGLIEALSAMHRPASRNVSCEADTGGLRADQDTAIGIGIILCELLSNCYQHAFPYATGGHIDIRVMPVEGGLHRLVVKDNGKGLAEGYADGPGKLGLEIVEAMAEQLDGSFHVRAGDGVTFEVLFRMGQGQAAG